MIQVNHHRGMLRIATFFMLVVALLMLADHVINRGLRRIKTSAFGVTNRVLTGRINAEIVITGSSRAVTHYDSRIIQATTGRSTFNLGINGSQTDMQLAMLKAYLNHNTRPGLLIHNLDLFTFITTKEIYDPAQYFPYLDEEPIFNAVKKIYPEAWKWRTLPLYPYAVEDMRFTWLGGIRGFLGWNPTEDRFQGFTPRHTPWTGEFERFKAAHPEGLRFEIEAEGLQALDELVAICRQRGIRVLLVYSPVYYEMRALETNRDEVFAHFRRISERYDAPIWDYSDSPVARDKQLFYNSQHLNADGAAAFSRALAQRLAVSSDSAGLLPGATHPASAP